MREKLEAIRRHNGPECTAKERGLARTRRGSKIGLILIVWLVLLGWIGISSYNVIRQQYPSVYAEDRSMPEDDGAPNAGKSYGGSIHDSVAAGPAVDRSAGLLLTSGLVVFVLATAIRLVMNKRMHNDT